jgi:hypothetical protein
VARSKQMIPIRSSPPRKRGSRVTARRWPWVPAFAGMTKKGRVSNGKFVPIALRVAESLPAGIVKRIPPNRRATRRDYASLIRPTPVLLRLLIQSALEISSSRLIKGIDNKRPPYSKKTDAPSDNSNYSEANPFFTNNSANQRDHAEDDREYP